jgi:uncharacterized protein (UPF0548 family)
MAVPVLRLGRMSAAGLDRLLAAGRAAVPTYAPVGDLLRADGPAPDLVVERSVGSHPGAFAAALECLRSLAPQRSVATVWPAGAAAEAGATVLVALPVGPVTVVAVNRVVAVVDEPDRWGFAYGTLPGHPEVGEEAFVVERRADGEVLVRITATARVALPAARLARPVLGPLQRRFAGRYLDAVEAAVRAATPAAGFDEPEERS